MTSSPHSYRTWRNSGSVLGRIHHHDPRAPAALVGAAVQPGGSVCSLQWSPSSGEDRLASGSKDGHLSVWEAGPGGGNAGQTAAAAAGGDETAQRREGELPGGGWSEGWSEGGLGPMLLAMQRPVWASAWASALRLAFSFLGDYWRFYTC